MRRLLPFLAACSLQACGGAERPTTTIALPASSSPSPAVVAIATRQHAIVEDGPPSGPLGEEALRARSLSLAGRWEEAAVAWGRLASGDTGQPVEVRQLAEYEVGEAYHHLGLRQASYAVFSSIAARPQHLRFRQSFQWLAWLADELPEPADVPERTKELDPASLRGFERPEQVGLGTQLSLLRGRLEYRSRHDEEAVKLFAEVGVTSPYAPEALYFSGLSKLRLGAIDGARKDFEALFALPSPPDGRYRNLAALALGRIAFRDAATIDASGRATVDPTKISPAISQWARVDARLDIGLDARLEIARAYVLAGLPARALGELPPDDTIGVGAMRVIALGASCEKGAAAALSALDHDRASLQAALHDVLAREPGDGALAAMVLSARARRPVALGALAPLVDEALRRPAIHAYLDYVDRLDEEAVRLRKLSAAFTSSPVGADAIDAIELGAEIVRRNLDLSVRAWLEARQDELVALFGAASNGPAGAVLAFPATNLAAGAGDEHVAWPSDAIRLPAPPRCPP